MAFADKVVLITGASSGIGASAAEAFAGLSANLSLVGRNEANLRKVAAICEKNSGVTALPIVADVSKDADVERIIQETIDKFGRLDVLVNNAGFASPSKFEDGIEPYDTVMAINIRAVYLLTSLAAPHLGRTKGNVVNVSSTAAVKPTDGFMSYCISKAALDMFTKSAALELARSGVRVNSVNPGLTRTNFFKVLGMSEDQEAMMCEREARSAPLKRIAEGKDVADTIVHLAGDRARCITGIVVAIDNGTSLTSTTVSADNIYV